MKTVYTIGYEGAALSDFLVTLKREGIEHLLDVRELAQSRRPGFSKRALTEALASVGISYSHAKQLGDPKHGREAARRGEMDTFRAIFEAHLDLPLSQNALKEAADLVQQKATVLLCYERDPKCCHRALVVKRLEGLSSILVQHLGVRSRATDERRGEGAVAARAA